MSKVRKELARLRGELERLGVIEPEYFLEQLKKAQKYERLNIIAYLRENSTHKFMKRNDIPMDTYETLNHLADCLQANAHHHRSK